MQFCINIEVGVYLLSQKFKKYGYSWCVVGVYYLEIVYYRDKYVSKIMKIVNFGFDFV